MTTRFWIEKGWGDSIDNAVFNDIEAVIEEIIKMDQEHNVLWVGNLDNEYVMEVHKDLTLFFICGESQYQQLRVKLKNWDEVKIFYKLFFDSEFERLKNEIKSSTSK